MKIVFVFNKYINLDLQSKDCLFATRSSSNFLLSNVYLDKQHFCSTVIKCWSSQFLDKLIWELQPNCKFCESQTGFAFCLDITTIHKSDFHTLITDENKLQYKLLTITSQNALCRKSKQLHRTSIAFSHMQEIAITYLIQPVSKIVYQKDTVNCWHNLEWHLAYTFSQNLLALSKLS